MIIRYNITFQVFSKTSELNISDVSKCYLPSAHKANFPFSIQTKSPNTVPFSMNLCFMASIFLTIRDVLSATAYSQYMFLQ